MGEWQSLLRGDGLAGWVWGGPDAFRREGDLVRGADGGSGDQAMTGPEEGWTDFELAAEVTVHSGALAQLHYRITPERRWHTLDLRMGQQLVTLGTADNGPGGFGLRKDAERLVPLELGREYRLRIEARGDHATGWIDELEVGRIALVSPRGKVGLGLYEVDASFRNPRIRVL